MARGAVGSRRRGGSPAVFSPPPSKGFVSWRDPKSGSWYVETLDDIFEQWAHSEDLQSLLLRVSAAFLCKGEGRLLRGSVSSWGWGFGGEQGRPKPRVKGSRLLPLSLGVGTFMSLYERHPACGDVCPLFKELPSLSPPRSPG